MASERLRFTSFGDSITQRERWQPFVVKEGGFVHTNCGIGGSPLGGSRENAYWRPARLDAVKASEPDILTILGGANDLVPNVLIGTDDEFEKPLAEKDTNTFKGAYSYIIEELLAWKPDLRILVLTTTWGHNDGLAMAHTTGLRYRDYAQASREAAQFYGLPIVDLYYEAGFNKWTNDTYIPDNIHPNEAGGKRIAELVIGKMKSLHLIG